jgi:hypothetical protein
VVVRVVRQPSLGGRGGGAAEVAGGDAGGRGGAEGLRRTGDLQHAAHADEGGVRDQTIVGTFFGHGGAELGIAEAAIAAEVPAEVGTWRAVEGVIERAVGLGEARPAHGCGGWGCR